MGYKMNVPSVRVTGRVKFFIRAKGFGFITRGDRERDIFVHVKDLPAGVLDVMPDQKVSFIVEETPRGLRAKQVEFVN